MKTQDRMSFIGQVRGRPEISQSQQLAGQELSKEDRLRQIMATRVNNTEEFDELFNAAVKRQQEAKREMELENEPKKEDLTLAKDDAFSDIDKELGF